MARSPSDEPLDSRLGLLVCGHRDLGAINLFHRARAASGRAGLAWLATAGITTGCGTWATHFIALLAYEPGIPVAYNVGLTALSLMAAAAITSMGFAVSLAVPGRWAAVVGGVVVGAGVGEQGNEMRGPGAATSGDSGGGEPSEPGTAAGGARAMKQIDGTQVAMTANKKAKTRIKRLSRRRPCHDRLALPTPMSAQRVRQPRRDRRKDDDDHQQDEAHRDIGHNRAENMRHRDLLRSDTLHRHQQESVGGSNRPSCMQIR